MQNKYRIAILFSICFIFSVSSCKKYLNVNTNPNVAQSATVQTLLPAAQLYVGTALGVDMEIDGSILAQYWTESPVASQYNQLSQYAPGQDYFSTPWSNLYIAAENFYQLYKLADSQKKKQYMAISLLMQAYTFQLLTDGWGDVPFSQALKGQFADGHVVNAKYDAQADVYTGIMAYIQKADSLLNPNDPVLPGADDLIYGGQMAQWQKFSNTLKLRILLRQVNINPTAAQAGITALFSKAATSNFIGEGDDAKIAYGFNTANKNPLYAEEVGLTGTQNLVGSKTIIDSMNSDGDYRSYIFYEHLSNFSVAGIPQGFIGNVTSGTYSIVSYNVAGDATNAQSTNAPVNFLTSYESYFLQAEAAARGWAAGNDDSALFVQGIQANFDYYAAGLNNQNILWQDTAGKYVLPSGDTLAAPVYLTGNFAFYTYMHGDTTYQTPPSISVPAYWASYSKKMTLTQKLRYIATQKWFCMCGNQGFEAWSEWRRTGYPDFFPYSASSIKGNVFPKRFLYPTSESTTDANFPGEQPFTAKVWWDLF